MNTTEIIALAGVVATALVSIFSKMRETPLTLAQAQSAEAAASLSLSQGWREYAEQIREDNTALRKEVDELRAEMEAQAKACDERIAELERQIKERSSVYWKRPSSRE